MSGSGNYISGAGAEIHDIGGVMMRPFDAWPYLEPPKVARIQTSEAVARAAIEAARSQLGKPFDHSALWGFLEDQAHEKLRNWRDNGQWFCSELCVWAEEGAKLFSYPLIVTKGRISPADKLLLINPFMRPENIAEFLPPLEPYPAV